MSTRSLSVEIRDDIITMIIRMPTNLSDIMSIRYFLLPSGLTADNKKI